MASTIQSEHPGGIVRSAATTRPWNDRLLVALLAASVIGVIVQITLGGVVRVTESGDGCPDWPTCFGRWVPPFGYHALLEWSHRTTGVLVGVFVLSAFARTLIRHRSRSGLVWLTFGSLALIAVVGGVGGRVVLSGLNPALRTAHLGLAEADLLPLIMALVVAATPSGARRVDPIAGRRGGPVAALAALAAGALLIALLSGSYAVWRGAGPACPSWPLCGDGLAPQYELPWIQTIHRLFAAAGVAFAAWAAVRALRIRDGSRGMRAAAAGLIVVTAAEVLIGAANPWTDFSQWARAAHLGLATLLWADAALLAVLIWLPFQRAGERGIRATVE